MSNKRLLLIRLSATIFVSCVFLFLGKYFFLIIFVGIVSLVVLQDYRKYKHRESLETQIHLTFDEALEFYKKNKITKILVGKLGQFAGNYEVNKSLVASAMDALEISLITGESKLVHLPLGMTKSVCIFLDECKKQGLVVEGTYQNQKLISFKTLVFIGALIVVTATIVFVANH